MNTENHPHEGSGPQEPQGHEPEPQESGTPTVPLEQHQQGAQAPTEPLPAYQAQGSAPVPPSAPGTYPPYQPAAGGQGVPPQPPAGPAKGAGWSGLPTAGKVAILGGAAVVLLLVGGGSGFAIGRVTAPNHAAQQIKQLRQGQGGYQGPGQGQGTRQYPGNGNPGNGNPGNGNPGSGNGQQGMPQRPGNIAGLGASLHGEYVVQQNGSYVTMLEQQGQVTSASDTRITVKSADGFEQSYTIDSKTAFPGQGKPTTGSTVQVVATKDGMLAQRVVGLRAGA